MTAAIMKQELLAQAWAEGHKAGSEDTGAMTGWAYRTQQPPYGNEPMPKQTPNPYQSKP